jgi:hypothetical protein
MHSGVFRYFHIGLFVISRIMRGFFSNLKFIFNIKFWKAGGACFPSVNALVASALFQRRVWCNCLFENDLSSCHWKRHHVMHPPGVLVMVRFFFLFPTFLSFPIKMHVCSFLSFFFFFNFSSYVFCFLILYFTLLEKVFLCFQFSS